MKINKKCSTGQSRNVTPMRAAPSIGIATFLPKLSGRARRQRIKCNVDGFIENRGVKTGGRNLIGRSMTSRSMSGQCKINVNASKDSSQDTTSLTMPSGVSSFLLDCLEADSSTFNADSTLSSIEEFRKADCCDEGISTVIKDEIMNNVKNSTLLDLSHAQDLALHQPPDLSSILELSLNTAEDKQKDSLSSISLSPVRVPTETLPSDFASGCLLENEKRTPDKSKADTQSQTRKQEKQCFAEKKKVIKCRKVMFSDIVRIRNISDHKSDHHHGGVQHDRLIKRSEFHQISSHKSGDVSAASAKFFDFSSECEREKFFHRLEQKFSFQFPAKTIISPSSVL